MASLQRIGVEFYYKKRQEADWCQMCGNAMPLSTTGVGGSDYLQ